MDLAEAASKLRGRQGELVKLFNVEGNLVHLPLRFPEAVESLRSEITGYSPSTDLESLVKDSGY